MSEHSPIEPRHLCYDTHDAPDGHPKEVMRTLGIAYDIATPKSFGDQWWFLCCEDIPEILPPYLEYIELVPQNHIGSGLSKEEADMITAWERRCMTDKTVVKSCGAAQTNHEEFVRDYYPRSPWFQKTGVCSGLSDAAHLCDAIAVDILAEHTKRGRTTKQGQELAAALLRASDAIWRMREELAQEDD